MVTEGQPQAARARLRPTFRKVRVERVEQVTPHFKRITFGGSGLADFATRGPAEHIKAFFPKPGHDEVVLPEWGPNGLILAEDQEHPTSRTYTPRRWDPQRSQFDVDFLLHGDGPGSTWAKAAKPGNRAVIAGPGGPFLPEPEAEWLLIAGDDTAVPAITTVLDVLPASARVTAYIKVENALEEQPLEGRAKVDVRWVHRGPTLGIAGQPLEEAFRQASLPAGRGQVFVACEATIMRNIRRWLIDDQRVDRAWLYTRGYWKYGAVNHPDRDTGEKI